MTAAAPPPTPSTRLLPAAARATSIAVVAMPTLEPMRLVVATPIVVELVRALQPRLPARGPRPHRPSAAAA